MSSELKPAEVTRDEVMQAAKEATAPEWQDVVDGWHMGLDLMKFTSLILALRPVQVPMTDEQMWDLWNSQGVDDMIQHEAIAFARAVEAHHGITAQAKKEDE